MKFNLQWLSFKCKIIENIQILVGTFFKFTGYRNRKAINIFKHPICDANIWHHKTNVKIQPFCRKIGEKLPI